MRITSPDSDKTRQMFVKYIDKTDTGGVVLRYSTSPHADGQLFDLWLSQKDLCLIKHTKSWRDLK
jgi:hypothetical protein